MVIMESEYGSSFRPVRGGGRIVVPVGAVTDSFGPPLCRGVTPFLLRVNKTVTLSLFFPNDSLSLICPSLIMGGGFTQWPNPPSHYEVVTRGDSVAELGLHVTR